MFEKSLQDLVKGIRSHKRDPSAFISQSIQEIKLELRNTDPFVKSQVGPHPKSDIDAVCWSGRLMGAWGAWMMARQAVRKLTFLQMMGYDMSWASFAVVEVMSSPRFAHKRIGYLAACQTFTDDTDVVLLTTNLLKKEFQSPNQYEVGHTACARGG
jgi:AP-3 complex subunit delta